LAEMSFEGAEPAATGRPSYHPSGLLKLYGYLNRVQSSRRLEREAGRNVEVMWLLGRLAPDHKTIADFRKDNGLALRKVCTCFVVSRSLIWATHHLTMRRRSRRLTLTIAQLFLYWHLAYFFEIANASRALGCKIGSCLCCAFANAWEQVLCCPNHFRLLRRAALYNPNFPGEPDKCRRRKWYRSKAPSPGRRLGSLPEQLPDEASCETYASLRFVTGR
jgi:hypothetical protein